MCANKTDPMKKDPPANAIKSIQFDLFSTFVSNDGRNVSNTVEMWESIPKYFFTPRQVEKLRTDGGLAEPFKWEYSYNGKRCTIKIQPALIEQKDGKYKAFFPGVTEELVEEALKKILTDQRHGIHDPKNVETWVRFSLSMIQRELSARGRTRSRAEIKHAIEVMSGCTLTFYSEGKEVWRGNILQDLVTVGRDEYIADTDSLHAARLPLFISLGINQIDYRQYNYARLMGCDQQLARWIYRRLINRFKQADLTNSYHFIFSDLKASGLLQQGRERDNHKKVMDALQELKDKMVLADFTAEKTPAGDWKYTVTATGEFVSEQKAANKRRADSEQKAINAGISVR